MKTLTKNKIKYKFISDIRLINPKKEMNYKYDLELLSNGMIIAEIEVFNIVEKNVISQSCKALIDTGAEVSFVSGKILDQLNIDSTLIKIGGISSIHGNREHQVVGLGIRLPFNNPNPVFPQIYSDDFERKEYQAIIGINILKDMELIYSGYQERAWLNY